MALYESVRAQGDLAMIVSLHVTREKEEELMGERGCDWK